MPNNTHLFIASAAVDASRSCITGSYPNILTFKTAHFKKKPDSRYFVVNRNRHKKVITKLSERPFGKFSK
jgi:hypothetical protein